MLKKPQIYTSFYLQELIASDIKSENREEGTQESNELRLTVLVNIIQKSFILNKLSTCR